MCEGAQQWYLLKYLNSALLLIIVFILQIYSLNWSSRMDDEDLKSLMDESIPEYAVNCFTYAGYDTPQVWRQQEITTA